MGTPKSEIGMVGRMVGQEIQGFCRISKEKPLIRGTPGNAYWGPHFGGWGVFVRQMRMAKVDIICWQRRGIT